MVLVGCPGVFGLHHIFLPKVRSSWSLVQARNRASSHSPFCREDDPMKDW